MKRILAFILIISLVPESSLADGENLDILPTHQLIINEVMAGSEVNPEKDHWIELYNPTDEEILLFNWQIRGVTEGGQWIDLVAEDYRAIQPHDFFLISHYTNSRSSALAVRPQVNKTSFQFPPGPLQIELRDPAGQITDMILIERASGESDYRSYERRQPIADGMLSESWGRARTSVNLKPELLHTYATPFALNSDVSEVSPPVEQALPPTPLILINEVLPNPKKREAEQEFIELVNMGAAAVDLRGWELDDENGDDDRSYFFIDEARDYVLDPGEFLVLYNSETLISLGNLGDGVQLFDTEGNLVGDFFFAPELEGRSLGRQPEDPENWIPFGHPTPGSANIEVNHPPAPAIHLQQDSRYMTVNVTGEQSYDSDGDRLTFLWEFEPGASDTRENPLEYTYMIPGPKTIFLTVTDEFGLSASAQITFEAKPIPGSSNPSFLPPPSYQKSDLVFEAALPNPDKKDEGKELIRLRNTTFSAIDLKDWQLQEASGKSVRLGSFLIEAGQSSLLTQDFFRLTLNNAKEQLILVDPAGNEIDRIEWDEAASGQWILNANLLQEGLELFVLRVIDGDTFEADREGMPLTVRLLGVDTPETVHPFKAVEFFGKEASDYLTNRLEGQTVRPTFEPNKLDKYGRVLAYVYLGETLINAELIEKGYAYAYTRFPFQHRDWFLRLEAQAKAAGLGLWQNQKVRKIIEEQQKIAIEEKPMNMPSVGEDVIPTAVEGPLDYARDDNRDVQDDNKRQDCNSSFLKIHSILPNPQKGEWVEYIRLINTGPGVVCLQGWSLDDDISKGSKSHLISGGGIASGGVRTFRLSETRIRLNNQDDCASLLNPAGELMDKICYGKTHKNEVFTHGGGNWVAKKRTSKRIQAAPAVPRITRSAYSHDQVTVRIAWIQPHNSGLPTSFSFHQPQAPENTFAIPLEFQIAFFVLMILGSLSLFRKVFLLK